MDGNGRILVTGKNYTDSDPQVEDMAIWRFNTAGSLDTTFNTPQGWVTHDNAADGNGYDLGYDIIVDGLGKILVTGQSNSASADKDMVIWRYNSDGSLDTTFNEQGWVTHNSAAGGDSYDTGGCISIDNSGKIVVSGKSVGPSSEAMVIWRYE